MNQFVVSARAFACFRHRPAYLGIGLSREKDYVPITNPDVTYYVLVL